MIDKLGLVVLLLMLAGCSGDFGCTSYTEMYEREKAALDACAKASNCELEPEDFRDLEYSKQKMETMCERAKGS